MGMEKGKLIHEGKKELVLIFHNETVFNTNEDETKIWANTETNVNIKSKGNIRDWGSWFKILLTNTI